MKNVRIVTCLVILAACGAARAAQNTPDLNAPVPDAARELVKKAIDMANRDQVDESLATLKKAIAMAPHYVKAHTEYIRIKTYIQGKPQEARAEYDALMAKEPNNPVYVMAVILAPGTGNRRPMYERVMQMAPDWIWTHYARAQMADQKSPDVIVTELVKMIEKDDKEILPRQVLITTYERQKKFDEAIAVAEKMAARPDFKVAGQSALWRLRFAKAQKSEAAAAAIKEDLRKVAASTRDLDLLLAVRTAYVEMLKDTEAARPVEDVIRQIDKDWYLERGKLVFTFTANASGAPRQLSLVNRDVATYEKMSAINKGGKPAKERIAEIEKLLATNPGASLKWLIQMQIFSIAQTSGDVAAATKYGEILAAADPKDIGLYAGMASLLAAQRTDLRKALDYAQRVDAATAEFRPLEPPADMDAQMFNLMFTQEKQKERNTSLRATALEAMGIALCETGKCAEGEAKLREALTLQKTEKRIGILSELLAKAGRKDEADKLKLEAANLWIEEVKGKMVNRPAKDFDLTTLDGRKVKLSDYKGKVVLLDFWATWCVPCAMEMPELVKAYNKYKNKGFEVLAISVDEAEDHPKVAPFLKKYNADFSAGISPAAAQLYSANVLPTTLYIDKQGNIRYVEIGFNSDKTPRIMDYLINELLK